MKREESSETLVGVWKKLAPFWGAIIFAIVCMATTYVLAGRLFPATGPFGWPGWTLFLVPVALLAVSGSLVNRRRNREDSNGDV